MRRPIARRRDFSAESHGTQPAADCQHALLPTCYPARCHWLATIERRLDPGRFVRIHRSAIVNVDKVKELWPAFHGEFEVVLSTNRRLRCSRTYAAELTRVLEA